MKLLVQLAFVRFQQAPFGPEPFPLFVRSACFILAVYRRSATWSWTRVDYNTKVVISRHYDWNYDLLKHAATKIDNFKDIPLIIGLPCSSSHQPSVTLPFFRDRCISHSLKDNVKWVIINVSFLKFPSASSPQPLLVNVPGKEGLIIIWKKSELKITILWELDGHVYFRKAAKLIKIKWRNVKVCVRLSIHLRLWEIQRLWVW